MKKNWILLSIFLFLLFLNFIMFLNIINTIIKHCQGNFYWAHNIWGLQKNSEILGQRPDITNEKAIRRGGSCYLKELIEKHNCMVWITSSWDIMLMFDSMKQYL